MVPLRCGHQRSTPLTGLRLWGLVAMSLGLIGPIGLILICLEIAL